MSGQQRRPNFFVVGAPRCGTTSLHDWLNQSPDIFMCPLKEPHAFGLDLDDHGSGRFTNLRDHEKYLRLFVGANTAKIRGESSVFYLYSESAAREIHEFEPNAKILISLRNPAGFVYSVYRRQVWHGNEDLSTFEGALAAEEPRYSGARPLPRSCHNPLALRYKWMGRYSPHVERFIKEFGPESVKIITLEQLIADPEKEVEAILEFLGVPPVSGMRFEKKNEGAIPRSHRLQVWINRLWMSRRLESYPRLKRAVRGLWKLNLTTGISVPMKPETREQLNSELAPDAERLGEIVGQDFCARWGMS